MFCNMRTATNDFALSAETNPQFFEEMEVKQMFTRQLVINTNKYTIVSTKVIRNSYNVAT